MGDLNTVLTAISTVGFPILCCIAMAWFVKYNTDKNREEVASLNRDHKEEMNEVTKAVTNNTLVMQKLIDAIGVKWGDANGGQSILPNRDP